MTCGLAAVSQYEADTAPEPPVDPSSRPGDLWICGEHRVLCGDATVLADVEKGLAGELADMAFTDPPYNVNYANSAKDKMRGKDRAILNDNLGDGFYDFIPGGTDADARPLPGRRVRRDVLQ